MDKQIQEQIDDIVYIITACFIRHDHRFPPSIVYDCARELIKFNYRKIVPNVDFVVNEAIKNTAQERSEYQRLTDEDLIVIINASEYGDMTKFLLYAHRLWKLENKIKQGLLVECVRERRVFIVKQGCEVHFFGINV